MEAFLAPRGIRLFAEGVPFAVQWSADDHADFIDVFQFPERR